MSVQSQRCLRESRVVCQSFNGREPHVGFDPSNQTLREPSVVYEGVMPAAQPQAMHQLARKTHHLERFHNPLRPRVSRLVRETWSCSKQVAMLMAVPSK